MPEPDVALRPGVPVVTAAWLRPSRAERTRLFCFPFAGGNSSTYRAWPPIDGIEMRPVELPGRQARFREPALERMDALTDLLIAELTPELAQPFAFFGHSMGALIAYALTLALRRHGLPQPFHLLLSAHSAPSIARGGAPLHRLPDADLVAEVERLGSGLAGIMLQRELLTVMLPTLRADIALCETYLPNAEPPLDMPISAFGGLQDASIGHAQLAAWRRHTCGPFSLRWFPGDHHYLNGSSPALCLAIARLLGGGPARRTIAGPHPSRESCTRGGTL